MPKDYYKVENYDSRRSIGYLTRRCGKLVTAQIQALFAKRDVTFVQWVILLHLHDNISLTAAELCQHLCHDSGALTRVLDQMVERGFITRKRSLEDRRMLTLELAEGGEKVIKQNLPSLIGLYNGLLEDFTKEEADTLINLLSKLTANLTKSSAQTEN